MTIHGKTISLKIEGDLIILKFEAITKNWTYKCQFNTNMHKKPVLKALSEAAAETQIWVSEDQVWGTPGQGGGSSCPQF